MANSTHELFGARQFLFSPVTCDQLEHWQHVRLGGNHLYAHPLIQVDVAGNEPTDTELALVGHIIDPDQPNHQNKDILKDFLSGDTTVDGITKKLYRYPGRFVLIVRKADQWYVFHDACGLKSVFYTRTNGQLYMASQPLLLKHVLPLKEGERFDEYQASVFKKATLEHWIPCGISLFEDVQQLVPNHYLDVRNYTQVRFWPVRQLQRMDMQEAVEKASELLRKSAVAYHHRFKLALALTAGFDSRTILSACKPVADDIYFYTLQYRKLKKGSTELKVPRKILSAFGYKHHVIDCRKEVDPGFAAVYNANSDMAHLCDWGVISHGMSAEYPSDRVAVKGNCAEVGRCFYYKHGTHEPVTSASDIVNRIPHWDKLPFVNVRMHEWYEELTTSDALHGYDILDMFYWEHRMGSWQAQSQLESDMVYESATPYNNRELLDIILAVDPAFRSKPDFTFFRNIVMRLWPEALDVPINPRSSFHYFRVLKNVLKAKLKGRVNYE
ncbi:MAG: hypothetical protein H6585_05390 [Flavobacteriales bacterium]|nr:hypothetical protein [Flavobacteriales bacterium]MCB9447763.1 hypothetical protein [Flavobacteriales bacterium]